MSSRYYSLDDILIDSQLLSSTFLVQALNLGYLDETNDLKHLKPNTNIKLPVWAAIPLSQGGIVSVERPAFYGNKFRLNLAADATVISLGDRCMYFYELGVKLCESLDWHDLSDMLGSCLASRYQAILDRAQLIKASGYHEFKNRLTEFERVLFDFKLESMSSYKQWRSSGNVIQESSAVQVSKRRKISSSKQQK
jgi:GINS complex subunit 3